MKWNFSKKLDFKDAFFFMRHRGKNNSQHTRKLKYGSAGFCSQFRLSPGKIMRICSLFGALVHTGKDEIKRWCNGENRKAEGWQEGRKKSV